MLVFFFFRGMLKGFVSTLFSLLGTFFVFAISYQFCAVFSQIIENLPIVQGNLTNFISNTLDTFIPGQFSSMAELESAFSKSSISNLFLLVFTKLTKDITFEGVLSAGQILAPTLCKFLVRIIAFFILFVSVSLIIKLLKFLINKFIKVCGLSFVNRLLGGILGLLKGLFLFAVLYAVLLSFANFLPNVQLLQFVQQGEVSQFIYNKILAIILNLF